MKTFGRYLAGALALAAVIALSGCAWLGNEIEKIDQAFTGVSATMWTYDEEGYVIDEVHGESFRVTRDDKFDSSDSEGNSNEDSSVLKISLGDSHISHVGSSMIMAEDGIVDISEQLRSDNIFLQNSEEGTPWLNDLIETHRNLWDGKGKTIMVRSQSGQPIAVFAGDSVEIFATDVPKSTLFYVDSKYLLVYRADYTVYDNDLLNS